MFKHCQEKKSNYFLILFYSSCLLFYSCTSVSQHGTEDDTSYPRMIGDIEFDPRLDDSLFQLCHSDSSLVQYYAFGEKTYGEEKIAIERLINEKYNQDITPNETGLLRVRFVVNCKGETGRFRLLGMNPNYTPRDFDPSITNQIIDIIQSLDQWKVFKNNRGREIEYYQYLIFKIESGEIKELMP